MAYEEVPSPDILSVTEMGLLFDIAVRSESANAVSGVLHSTCQLRILDAEPIEAAHPLVAYDNDWVFLRAAGVEEPITDDPRQLGGPFEYLSRALNKPEYLFKTRAEMVAFAQAEKDEDQAQLGQQLLKAIGELPKKTAYDDAVFLLSLVGARMENGNLQFGEIHPQKLAEVQEIALMLSAGLRPFFDANPDLLDAVDPRLAAEVTGSSAEIKELEKLFELGESSADASGEDLNA